MLFWKSGGVEGKRQAETSAREEKDTKAGTRAKPCGVGVTRIVV